jgi:PAS domain S-box-containing protein
MAVSSGGRDFVDVRASVSSKPAERPKVREKHVRILFYEDSPDDAALMLRQLRRAGYEPQTRRVDTEDDLRSALHGDDWQVAVVDYMVPGFPGKAALKLLAKEAPDTPVIVASGHAPEEVVAATIRLGAVDYLLKDDLTRATPAVEHALAEHHTRRERSLALAALRENEARYRDLFDYAPVALCELDLTRCRQPLGELATRGGDLAEYLRLHPDIAKDIAAKAHIVHVNDAAIRLFEARDERELRDESERIWAGGFSDAMPELLYSVAATAPVKGVETHAETVGGKPLSLLLHVDFMGPGDDHRGTVLMSMTDITEQRLAQDTLAERERTLSTLFSNLPGVVYRCSYDPSFTSEFESEGVLELTGYPPAQSSAAHQGSFELKTHPDDRDAVWTAVQAAVEQDKPFTLTYRMRTADGTERWLWDRGRAVRGPDGTVEALEGFIGDITEQKVAEQELRETRDRLQALMEATNAIIYTDTLTNPGVTTYISGNVERVFGHTAPAWLSDPAYFDERVFAEDLPALTAATDAVLRSGEGSVDYRFQHADGTYRWIHDEMRLALDEAGIPIAVVGQLWDITDRKDAEEAIAAGAERLRRTVHGAVAAMGSVVERRDPYTAGHERHVAELAVLIGRELGFSAEELETLELAAEVHDIGKIGVPAEILARPGQLAGAEIDIVRMHPEIGHGILASVEFEGPVAEIVLQHHERLDGSGYPRGLRGEEILPAARIVAVADVVEAMASHRPYRPALGMEAALDEIHENSGRLYDAQAVAACERIVRDGGFTFS